MSTNALLAIPCRTDAAGETWHWVYTHWDGYPEWMMPALVEIVQRDGYDTAIRTLITESPDGWSQINPQFAASQDTIEGFEIVEGYGTRYDDGSGMALTGTIDQALDTFPSVEHLFLLERHDLIHLEPNEAVTA